MLFFGLWRALLGTCEVQLLSKLSTLVLVKFFEQPGCAVSAGNS